VDGGRRGGARLAIGSVGVVEVPFAIRRQAAPEPSLAAGILALDSLTDICDWLGTYAERLRVARTTDQPITEAEGRGHPSGSRKLTAITR